MISCERGVILSRNLALLNFCIQIQNRRIFRFCGAFSNSRSALASPQSHQKAPKRQAKAHNFEQSFVNYFFGICARYTKVLNGSQRGLELRIFFPILLKMNKIPNIHLSSLTFNTPSKDAFFTVI